MTIMGITTGRGGMDPSKTKGIKGRERKKTTTASFNVQRRKDLIETNWDEYQGRQRTTGYPETSALLKK